MQDWPPKVSFCQANPMSSFGKVTDFLSKEMTSW